MKRYDFMIGRTIGGRDTGVACIDAEESDNGEWVRYEDVAPLVRHKNADWFQRGRLGLDLVEDTERLCALVEHDMARPASTNGELALASACHDLIGKLRDLQIIRPGTHWILTRVNYHPGAEDRAECSTFVDVVYALRRWFGASLPQGRFSETGVDFDFGDDPVATMREVFRAADAIDDREVLADLVGRVTALENRAAPVDFQRLLTDLLSAVDKEQKEYGLGGDENEKMAWLVLLDRVRAALPAKAT